MKRSLALLSTAILCCSALFLTGCGDNQANGGKKVLKMATEATFPPYEYFENGKVCGIDVDIVTEITKNLGYDLEVVDMKFDSVILSVQTSKCDIAASGITVTEDRKKQINFTHPYVTAAQVIIVPKESKIGKPEDLKDEKIRIAVQQGTTGDSYVATNLHEPLRYDNAGLAVAALLAAKCEAVVCDSEPAKVHVSKHPEVKILPIALTSEEYAFALNKKDTELLDGFNKELIKMRENGKLQAILDKYLNAKPE